MITGVHAVLYTRQADEVRAFFKDVLGLAFVDAGGGWPIFRLPPAELGIHPTDGAESTELFLLCDDIDVAVAELDAKGIRTAGPVRELDWGRLVELEISDSIRLGMYEPKHPSSRQPGVGSAPPMTKRRELSAHRRLSKYPGQLGVKPDRQFTRACSAGSACG